MEKQIKITTYQNNSTGTTVYTIFNDDIVALAYFEDQYNETRNGRKFLEEEIYNGGTGHTVNENIVMFYCMLKSGNPDFKYTLMEFKKILSADRTVYAQYTQFQYERRMRVLYEMQEFAKQAGDKKKAVKTKTSQPKTS